MHSEERKIFTEEITKVAKDVNDLEKDTPYQEFAAIAICNLTRAVLVLAAIVLYQKPTSSNHLNDLSTVAN